jgi:hypothetical protein
LAAERTKRPLWQCRSAATDSSPRTPRHSCGRYRLGDHFQGKPKELLFQTRVRFAGAVVRRSHLDASLWLKKRVDHRALSRIESFGRPGYGHHFRLRQPSDIDEPLGDLMREAYSMGRQSSIR